MSPNTPGEATVRAIQIVRRLCEPCLASVHQSRFNAVLRAVEAITVAQRISGAALGRALRGTSPRHGIKAIDRLLGNAKLARERDVWFAALSRSLLRSQRRIVVLIDWTQLRGDLWALVAAVPFRGRSLPVFATTHDKSDVGNPDVHFDFLRRLRVVLPPKSQVVVVADGGFRSPFFRACERAKIDFVIRLRNDRATAAFHYPERVPFGEIFRKARQSPRCLGNAAPYVSSRDSRLLRLVLGPRPPKALRRRAYRDDYERKRACEPWLLATTLENETAASVVDIYATRMQVEECFRDAKSGHLGWALRHALTTSTQRFDVLLLLVAIAFAAVMLIGAAADALGLERRFRASSRKTRVLSLFRLGNLVIASAAVASVRAASAWRFVRELRSIHSSLFPPINPPTSEGRPVPLPLPHGLFCSDCGWKGRVNGWPK
jgi:hypothetical protein